MAKKKNLIKDLHLDKPTSHGGWPDGHPGGFMDPNTPVYKQIANYLKAMGLADDDNPRARLAENNIQITENKLRSLIRASIEEARSRLDVLHPAYSPDFTGDAEAVKSLDTFAAYDPEYAEELYSQLGVDRGSIHIPHNVPISTITSIDDDTIFEILHESYQHHINKILDDIGWVHFEAYEQSGYYEGSKTVDATIDAIKKYAFELVSAKNITSAPGQYVKAQIESVGNDPEHYSMLTHQVFMEDLKDEWVERNNQIRYGNSWESDY